MASSDEKAIARQRILAAFGVSEEDLAAVERATGWNAARAAAELECEEFVEQLKVRAAATSELLGRQVGFEVRFDEGPALVSEPRMVFSFTLNKQPWHWPVSGADAIACFRELLVCAEVEFEVRVG